jgi:hypothetical protein
MRATCNALQRNWHEDLTSSVSFPWLLSTMSWNCCMCTWNRKLERGINNLHSGTNPTTVSYGVGKKLQRN